MGRLDKYKYETVNISGREIFGEEAWLTFRELNESDRAQLEALTDMQAIEAIYAYYFGYGFTNCHGVEFTTVLK